MQIKTGIDIVYIKKMDNLIEGRSRIFHASEMQDDRPEHLAGIFAVKEAFFKALEQNPDFLSLEVKKTDNGKPVVSYVGIEGIHSVDVSISHEKDYAVASVVMILDEK